MDIRDHQYAVNFFNSATSRVVGGSSDGEVTALSEFGLMLMGAGIPIYLQPIRGDATNPLTDAEDMKARFLAARFLRDLADKIEAKAWLAHSRKPEIAAGKLEF